VVSKHVGVIIIVMNCIVLSAFVSGSVDCNNIRGMKNIKHTSFALSAYEMSSSSISWFSIYTSRDTVGVI
jgi:hypothetical protein